MKVNFETRTIEMTKAESKRAANPDSETFMKFTNLRKSFPDFEIDIKTTAKKKFSYPGLDYDFMIKYIEERDDEENSIMKEFYRFRGLNEDGSTNVLYKAHSFGEVKMWFLEQFKEIEQFNAENDQKLEEIKKARAARRAA